MHGCMDAWMEIKRGGNGSPTRQTNHSPPGETSRGKGGGNKVGKHETWYREWEWECGFLVSSWFGWQVGWLGVV
jgi:hypothetical protein